MDLDKSKQTHYKGLLGELAFTLHLIKRGWKVYKPLDQNSRVDLVIEKKGKLKRIQIKYCTPRNGCLAIDLEHRIRKTKPFVKNDLEAIGAYDPINDKYYLIPFDRIFPKGTFWLRITKPASSQVKGINKAGDFEIK